MTTREQEVYDPLQGLEEQELLHTQTDDGEFSVVVCKIVPEGDREALWGMIETGFAALNSKSFELQSMAFDEFQRDVTSPDVLKYVTRDAEGRPVGYMTVHTNLNDITWIDQEVLKQAQDKVDPGAPSLFVGTLVVSPEKQGSEAIPNLIRASLAHFGQMNAASGRNALGFFDCAQANYPWLAEYVQGLVEPSDDFQGLPVVVKEIAVEYIAEEVTAEDLVTAGRVIRKLASISITEEDSGKYHILDAKHIYSIEFVGEDQV